jgi:Uma2 family endonuclease
MTVVTPQLRLRSIDPSWDFERWSAIDDASNRYEVIDGVLYMGTVPSVTHQRLLLEILVHVGLPADESGECYSLPGPVGVLMPGCEPVQPDFLLVRRDRASVFQHGFMRGAPDVIIEVLSPATVEYDTQIKRGAYARAGVPEYWVVRPPTRDVLVCWHPNAELGIFEETRLVATEEELISATMPVRVRVAELFSGSPDTEL